MNRLTRDGTVEPVSRDQILRRERGQGNVHFKCSADHEQRTGNLTRLIDALLYGMTKNNFGPHVSPLCTTWLMITSLNKFSRLLTLAVGRVFYHTSVPDVEINPEMPRNRRNAVPESNDLFSHHDEFGSEEPTMAELYRMLEERFDGMDKNL